MSFSASTSLAAVHEVSPNDAVQVSYVRQLMREFFAELGEDLSYQQVEAEVQQLPGQYSRSVGGCLLLLLSVDSVPVGCGCVGLRRLSCEIGEIKRFYVCSSYRGFGLGKKLLLKLIQIAREMGYQKLRLDTLIRLSAANHLYETLGFYEIPPYCYSPFNDAAYREYKL